MYRAARARLETYAQSKLDFALRERRCEAQGQAWLNRTRSRHVEGGGACATRCQRKTETGTDNVVHAGKVGSVKQVESLGHQLQPSPFAELNRAGQSQVEIRVIRTRPVFRPAPMGRSFVE